MPHPRNPNQDRNSTDWLIQWIRKQGGRATPKQLQKKNYKDFPTRVETWGAMEKLVEQGLARWEEVPPKRGTGRPSIVCVLIEEKAEEEIETVSNERKPRLHLNFDEQLEVYKWLEVNRTRILEERPTFAELAKQASKVAGREAPVSTVQKLCKKLNLQWTPKGLTGVALQNSQIVTRIQMLEIGLENQRLELSELSEEVSELKARFENLEGENSTLRGLIIYLYHELNVKDPTGVVPLPAAVNKVTNRTT